MTYLKEISEKLYLESEIELLSAINDIPPVSKYVVDSRKVEPGDLFVALKGLKVDGHDFLFDAFKKGAIAAIVDSNYQGNTFGLLLIRTPNPLEALQILAKNKVQNSRAKVVGITGSVGKTMTKDFLSHLLRSNFKVMATPGNQNSQIGLPLAILNEMVGDEDVLVLEMGMSQKGEIRKLVEIAPPDIAMITHIDKVHIANFNSLQDIIFEKSEILSHPKTTLGIFPEEIDGINFFSDKGSCIKQKYSLETSLGDRILSDSRIPFVQKHVLKNLLGAVTIAENLGCSYDELGEKFATLTLPEMRLTKIEKNGILFINDAYNACVASVKAAIDSLPCRNRKIAVLGGMAELGIFSDSAHLEVAEYTLGRIEIVFCLGEECLPIFERRRAAFQEVKYYIKMEELAAELKENLQDGDVVLVKGSCSKEMWKIIEMVF